MSKNKPSKDEQAKDEQAKIAKSKQKVEQSDLQQQSVAVANQQGRGTAPFGSGGSGSSNLLSRQPSDILSHEPSSLLSHEPSALLQRSLSDGAETGETYPQIRMGGRNFAQFAGQTGSPPRIQPKLMVGPVGDKHEREADQVAKQVMSAPVKPNSILPQMSVATAGVHAIQCYRDWKQLYKNGWKYSGGTMATHGDLGGLWHASVFRVDKDGNGNANGLFTHGFHLTMEGKAPLPHVFFDDRGVYQDQMTATHKQTAAYGAIVGPNVLAQDIEDAKALSGQVLAFLGPEIDEEQRIAMEEEEAQKKEAARIAEAQAFEEAAARFAGEQAAAAAQPENEDDSLDWLLKDAGFFGALTPYRDQLKGYLVGNGNEKAITYKKLIPLAQWYLGGKNAKWTITETPKALYTGWNKVPTVINWPTYVNSKETRKRGPSATGIPSEHRWLSFNGYASYRLHPSAKKPPKV